MVIRDLNLLDSLKTFCRSPAFAGMFKRCRLKWPPRSGDEILFEFMGTCESIEMRTIEDGRLNLLFEEFSKENSMRLHSNVPNEFVGMDELSK